MKTAKAIYNQIYQLTGDLVGTPLCSDQNFPVRRGPKWDDCQIETSSADVSKALKSIPYRELFYEMEKARSFNLKLLDGALLQLQYEVKQNVLIRHRLSFFPNPDLIEFQGHSEEYLDDDIYIDIMDPRIVVTPIRCDFDNRDNVAKNIEHPMSHLTIGQYENCRIPVVRPLMPSQFISFIIRNFYHTAYEKYCDKLTPYSHMLDITITEEEKNIIHMGVY